MGDVQAEGGNGDTGTLHDATGRTEPIPDGTDDIEDKSNESDGVEYPNDVENIEVSPPHTQNSEDKDFNSEERDAINSDVSTEFPGEILDEEDVTNHTDDPQDNSNYVKTGSSDTNGTYQKLDPAVSPDAAGDSENTPIDNKEASDIAGDDKATILDGTGALTAESGARSNNGFASDTEHDIRVNVPIDSDQPAYEDATAISHEYTISNNVEICDSGKGATENSNSIQERAQNTSLPTSIDSDALTGLRGLAALHVFAFHAVANTKVNLIGSFQMPLFYLLSGYSLALCYGRTKYDAHESCCCDHTFDIERSENTEQVLFKSFNFYRNRFARIMPVYYLASFVFASPLVVFEGNMQTAKLISTFVTSLFPIGMMLPPGEYSFPFAHVGWTVSTLWFFYLLFPILLPRLQKFSKELISKWILALYWTQLFIGIVLYVFKYCNETDLVTPYWLSTGWGVSRLPVFVMGLLAGLLHIEHHPVPYLRQNSILNFFNAWTPWRYHVYMDTVTPQKWSILVNAINVSHLMLILLAGLLSSLVHGDTGDILNWFLQLFGVQSLLIIIDGLTRDGGRSILSKVCRWRVTKELGRMSMSLYLTHMVLIRWFWVAVGQDVMWGIPIYIVVCPGFAWLLNRFVEEPMREALRVRTRRYMV